MAENEVIDKAGELFTKKYGPLPFWAWLAIAGGTAFTIRVLINKKNGISNTVVADSGTSTTASDTSSGTSALAGTPNNGDPINTGGGSIQTAGPTINQAESAWTTAQTNAEWSQLAVQAVTKTNMYDPYTIQMAIQAYLNGGQVNAQQQAIVSTAIKAIGVPPDDVIAPGPAGKAASVLTATWVNKPPTKIHTTVVVDLVWLDQNGKGITGNVTQQVAYQSGTPDWVSYSTFSIVGGHARVTIPVEIPGSKQMRFQSDALDPTYAQVVSNTLSWIAN